jgi:hypothetical protein
MKLRYPMSFIIGFMCACRLSSATPDPLQFVSDTLVMMGLLLLLMYLVESTLHIITATINRFRKGVTHNYD